MVLVHSSLALYFDTILICLDLSNSLQSLDLYHIYFSLYISLYFYCFLVLYFSFYLKLFLFPSCSPYLLILSYSLYCYIHLTFHRTPYYNLHLSCSLYCLILSSHSIFSFYRLILFSHFIFSFHLTLFIIIYFYLALSCSLQLTLYYSPHYPSLDLHTNLHHFFNIPQ